METAGASIGFNHWEYDHDGKVGKELITTSIWILASRVHISITTQVVTPTCDFAYLQRQVRAHSDQGNLQEVDLLDSDPSTRSFTTL